MSERLPYEDRIQEQLNRLPLPDEDQGWAAMKKMLDEDNDDGAIVIPPPANGCGKWSFLLLVLLLIGSGTWMAFHNGWFEKAGDQKSKSNDSSWASKNYIPNSSAVKQKRTDKSITDTTPAFRLNKKQDDIALKDSGKFHSSETPKPIVGEAGTEQKNKNSKGYNTSTEKIMPQKSGTGSTASIKVKYKHNDNARSIIAPIYRTPEVPPSGTPANIKLNDQPNRIVEKSDNDTNSTGSLILSDSIHTEPIQSNEFVADSTLQKRNVDSLPEIDSTKKVKNKLPTKSYFSAGIAMQQQIPLGAGSNGEKAKLADYIPSVYLRWNNENKKIFLQSEFKYGAPQYTKEFAYKNVVGKDSFNQPTIDTTYILRKTYYHQLPLSFHYHVTPEWSVGTGIVWTKFSSAISEQLIKKLGGFDSVSSSILQVKKDTVFSNSVFHFMLETQYKWNRFSLGIRYTQGLQPYIRYISPTTGKNENERNNSLQFFLRYELWRFKK